MSIYGLRMAARTLSYLTRKSVILQNNLANQSTEGFKLHYAYGTADPSGVPTLNQASKLSQGAFLRTDNPMDVALDGDGFFVVQTENGERLTRNGSFHLDPSSNQLVNGAGHPVLGEGGPITIDGTSVEINSDGTVKVDGTEVGRVRVVTVNNPAQMLKEGAHLFVPGGPLVDVEPGTTVRQFELEESNVNGVNGLSSLIEIQRSFAMMTGAMQSLDDVLETVTSNVGRV